MKGSEFYFAQIFLFQNNISVTIDFINEWLTPTYLVGSKLLVKELPCITRRFYLKLSSLINTP